MKDMLTREAEKFLRNNGYTFAKRDDVPAYNSEEIDFIAKIEEDRKLDEMRKDLRIIKKCTIFFVVLTSISILFSLFSIISLINSL